MVPALATALSFTEIRAELELGRMLAGVLGVEFVTDSTYASMESEADKAR